MLIILTIIADNVQKIKQLRSKAGDAIRTRDINLGKVALYPWATLAYYYR